MSDKHTYSTMRKVASHKTRKLYIFDSYATKQKQKDTKTDQTKEETKQLSKTQQIAKKVDLLEQDNNNIDLKAYHVYKGANFEDIPNDKKSVESEEMTLEMQHEAMSSRKRQYLKPPMPITGRKNKPAKMLHTMLENSNNAA